MPSIFSLQPSCFAISVTLPRKVTEIIMSLLIIADASKAPELFEKSANVYVRMAEEDVIGKAAYIKAFNIDDLKSFVADTTAEETEA